MVGAYSIALVVGLIGLLVVIFGGTLAENLGKDQQDPGKRIGRVGRMALAALIGFGMAGLSAEFSPLDLTTMVTFGLALVGAAVAAIWASYAGDRG